MFVLPPFVSIPFPDKQDPKNIAFTAPKDSGFPPVPYWTVNYLVRYDIAYVSLRGNRNPSPVELLAYRDALRHVAEIAAYETNEQATAQATADTAFGEYAAWLVKMNTPVEVPDPPKAWTGGITLEQIYAIMGDSRRTT